MGGYWGAISMLDKVNLWNKYGIGSPASNELKDKVVVCVGADLHLWMLLDAPLERGQKR